MSALLGIYRAASTLGAPAIDYYLRRRMARGKEDSARFHERLGQPVMNRPEGSLIWLHAASIGESLSMLPLIQKLLDSHDGWRIMVTTGTVTSAALMAERLPEGAFHQYVPVDRLAFVKRFLDHWRPNLALWSESEFWPNMIVETAARRIPLVLVNGRVSPESFRGWSRWRGLSRRILGGFDLCLAQGEDDAERLRRLGAGNVKCVGNLKFAGRDLPADATELEALRTAFAERPRWLAASTHPGEEEIVWQAHQTIRNAAPALLTVIVPRHPERGPEVAQKLTDAGARVARRRAAEAISPDTDVYIADSLGELGLFFRLSDIVFMGKSLVNLGGQNPLEAARLDCALLFGPHMWNFPDIAERLIESGGGETVADGAALAAAVERLLCDGTERQARAAADFATAEGGVLDAIMAELAPYLKADR